MSLSDEAATIIALNGMGRQSVNTVCHFCGVPGHHLYVLAAGLVAPTVSDSSDSDCAERESSSERSSGSSVDQGSESSAGRNSSAECGPDSPEVSDEDDTFVVDLVALGAKMSLTVKGEYRGRCTHLDYDGKPWCDRCMMLGRDGPAVYPSCPKCCGFSWGMPANGATSSQIGRRVLWTPHCEEVWRCAAGEAGNHRESL